MSSKKVSYLKVLKETLAEFDTSQTVDVKGPMVDPILSYNGDGELPTNKDAASILERYYFKEDDGISLDENVDNEIDEVPDKNINKTKKDIEKEVTEQKEEDEEEEKDDKEEVTEQKEEDEEEDKDDKEEKVEESTELDEVENAVLERLIDEMEELEEKEYPGDEGEGTKAAGTGKAEDKVPPRKDMTKEQKEEDDEEDLDVDKELDMDEDEEEKVEESAKPLPGGLGNEGEDLDELSEQFEIFKQAIEDDE